jgi:hypothetical protein
VPHRKYYILQDFSKNCPIESTDDNYFLERPMITELGDQVDILAYQLWLALTKVIISCTLERIIVILNGWKREDGFYGSKGDLIKSGDPVNSGIRNGCFQDFQVDAMVALWLGDTEEQKRMHCV